LYLQTVGGIWEMQYVPMATMPLKVTATRDPTHPSSHFDNISAA
jgi:hypothetical protein